MVPLALPEIGQPVSTLDTPALVLDLAAFERNLDAMAGFAAKAGIRLRPHAKMHKCSAVALAQMARGAVGTCCQTVREAETMATAGVPDVLVTNQVVSPARLVRLAELAKTGVAVTICVDDPVHVDLAAQAASEADAKLALHIEVDVGAQRSGVQTIDEALRLAGYIAARPDLVLTGLQAYHGGMQHLRSVSERREAAKTVATRATAFRKALEKAGHAGLRLTGGGTGSFFFDIEAAREGGGLDELQCGSYAFMDVDYSLNEWPESVHFEQALFVLTRIIGRPVAERAVIDAGLKALAFDSGPPAVHSRPDLVYSRPSDEHGRITLPAGDNATRIGDALKLVPGHIDPTVAKHNVIVAVRGEVVQGVWPIDAQGW